MAAHELFSQVSEEVNVLQRVMTKLPPPVSRAALWSLVALSGAAGYVATPSRRPPVSAAGGLLAMVLANVLRERLSQQLQQSAAGMVASRVAAAGVGGVTSEQVTSIGRQFGMAEDAWGEQLAELYKRCLLQALQSVEVQTAELAELLQLQALFGLSAMAVGDAHHEVAQQVYSYNRAYLEEEGDNKAKRILNKLIFLSDRVFAKDESAEGYRYEVGRVCNVFSLTRAFFEAAVEEAAVPFYLKALNVATTDVTKVTAEKLQAAANNLGLSSSTVQQLHLEAFRNFVSATLAVSPEPRIGTIEQHTIAALKVTLSLEPEQTQPLLDELVTPLYGKVVKSVLEQLQQLQQPSTAEYASLVAKLALKQQELLLDRQAALEAEMKYIREAASDKYKECTRQLAVQNLPQALTALDALVEFCDSVVALLAQGAESKMDAEGIRAKYLTQLSPMLAEARQLYSLFLSRCLEKRQVSAVEAKQLQQLQLLLGVSDAEALSIYKTATGPIYKKTLSDALRNNELSGEKQSELSEIAATLSIPDELTSTIAMDAYKEQLRTVADGGRIFTAEEGDQLHQLAKFLQLGQEAVGEVHMRVCASAYRNSVSEAMGSTGIIPDDVWDALQKLQGRLALPDSAAQTLFVEVATGRMKEMVNKAMGVLQSTVSSAMGGPKTFSDGSDAGDDPLVSGKGGSLGMEASVSVAQEVMNLVDFCERNRLIVQQQIELPANPELQGAAALAAAMQYKTETKYLATLEGMFGSKAVSQLYRQYLLECFSARSNEQKQRLFESLPTVAALLAVAAAEVSKVHSELGGLIYKNYLGPALAKGALTEQDRQFLSSIRQTLEMPQQVCDELVLECQRNRVGGMLERLFAMGSIKAADVRKMREAAELHEVNIVRELDTTTIKLKKLLAVEVEDAIGSGCSEEDLAVLIEELQDMYQIAMADTEQIVETCVAKRVTEHLKNAAASVRRNRAEDGVEEVGNMLRFLKLNPHAVAVSSVSEAEKQELYLLYQAKLLTAGLEKQQMQDSLSLLKTGLGFQNQ